jgi:glucose-1-phosphate thymidylyltransferase
MEAAEFVSIIQKRQGVYIACVEEVAYRMGFIGREQLRSLAGPLASSDYGRYLARIADEDGADIPGRF